MRCKCNFSFAKMEEYHNLILVSYTCRFRSFCNKNCTIPQSKSSSKRDACIHKFSIHNMAQIILQSIKMFYWFIEF